MAEHAGGEPLLAWVLAAFHTALFVAVAVLVLHLTQGLGLLAGVGTGAGSLLFLALWAITWWTNGKLLEDVGPLAGDDPPAMGRVVERGVLWGGATGALFWWVLLSALILREATEGGLGEDGLLFVASVVGFGGLATLVAVVVGAAVGGLLALADAAVLAAARRAVGGTGGARGSAARPEDGSV